MNKKRLHLGLWIAGLLVTIGISTVYLSNTLLKTDSTTSATTVPAAPTGLAASYSTENLGQPEVRLTVTDNATNETYYQLYWHLSGTAWPTTAPKDTYNTSTWSQPANVGRIQIFAPSVGGTYEYQLQACNSAGCSYSNIALINVPGTTASTTNTTVQTTPTTTPNVCTLDFKLKDNKTTYNAGAVPEDYVNYSYICLPAGTTAASVTIQLTKPDGTSTQYNSASGGNLGSYLQQMGFSTSNLTNGSYILKACLNNTSCGPGSIYSQPFTIVGGTTTQTPTQSVNPNSTPTTTNTTQNQNPDATANTTQNQNTNTSSTPTATATPTTTATPTATTTYPTWTTTTTTTNTPSTSTTTTPPTATSHYTQTVPTWSTTPTQPNQPQTQQISSYLSDAKCTRYLNNKKSILNSNARTIRDLSQKMKSAPKNYVNTNAITALLENANNVINDTKKLLPSKDCSQNTQLLISEKQDTINSSLQDLSDYNNNEIQHFKTYSQCKSTLTNRTKRIKSLMKKEKNQESKSSFQDTIDEITQMLQEFAQDASNANFPDVNDQCKNYIKALDDDINFYLKTNKP